MCKCGHNFSQTPHKLVRWGVQARARAPPQAHEVTTQEGSRERGAAVVAAENPSTVRQGRIPPCALSLAWPVPVLRADLQY